MRFPFYQQHDIMDCGPTCLRMVAKFYKRNYSLQTLRDRTQISKYGVNMLGINAAAESIGFRTIGAKLSFSQLEEHASLPCIVHWDQDHFVVLYGVDKKSMYVADPASGLLKYNKAEFQQHWISTRTNNVEEGVVLLLEPTAEFYKQEGEQDTRTGWKSLTAYVKNYRKELFQLIIGLIVGSIIQLIFPFLTKNIVDVGVSNNNLGFIYFILFAQLFLFLGRISVDFVRSWILLHVSTRINIAVLSDFFIKLMKLPVKYFDTRLTGDIMQRISDHERIEQFLTSSALNTAFSIVSLLIFQVVLIIYDIRIYLVFLAGSVIYYLWVFRFLKKRRELDFKRFEIGAKNQSKTIQMIQGMQEIKMNNCEAEKRWEWEKIQAQLFLWNTRSLSLKQNQQGGALLINELKNILITFCAAQAVIAGRMTLGEMLAVQYIIGQLNGPIEQLTQFFQLSQDARISLDRLNEVHEQPDEVTGTAQQTDLNVQESLYVKDVNFTYPGAGNEPVLQHVSLEIPYGKVTAIVGMSGSGKTTLLKLLLKFYDANSGDIKVGNYNLKSINHKFWRSKCGAVLQDGFIFSDTIAKNIAVSGTPDAKRLLHAVKMANIRDFVEELPLGFNTKIGADGNGISQGQRQRILIARAIYKEPEFIFFDEATNALDATNEREIMKNFSEFFAGKTVVVVAHRLSTVRNADQIVVLNKGRIAEKGTHEELRDLKGLYYNLVKNQLELDK